MEIISRKIQNNEAFSPDEELLVGMARADSGMEFLQGKISETRFRIEPVMIELESEFRVPLGTKPAN